MMHFYSCTTKQKIIKEYTLMYYINIVNIF